MHRIHNEPKTSSGPETSGLTIHWSHRYDFFTTLFGLGVNHPNSRMVVELAGIKPGDKVLDVGCGTGNLTLTAERAAGASGSVYGIDASPEMIEVAQAKAKRAGAMTIFEIGLIEKLTFPDGAFDKVISRMVIHHLPGDLKRQGFAEFFRVLKPGGTLLIIDFKPPENPVLNHLTSALFGHRMMHVNVSSYAAMLTDAGFVEVTSGPTGSAIMAFASGRKPSA